MSEQYIYDQKYDQILLEPFNYLMSNSGKQFRTKLIQAFNFWLKVPKETLITINEVIDMLHNASLLIDDIEDNSELRRGLPVAHKVYGLAQTLNSGNYCYFLAEQTLMKSCSGDKFARAVRIFNQKMLDLHRGQGLDIYWRDQSICPSEEAYIEMIRLKTGGLFGLAIELMKLFSDCDYDFQQLINSLSEYFQIRDDLANLVSDEYKTKKSFAEDLTEGKYSFPVIHAIKASTEDTTIQDILKKKTNDDKLKMIAINKMRDLGSFDYTLERIKSLDSEVETLIENFGGNQILSKLLDVLRNID